MTRVEKNNKKYLKNDLLNLGKNTLKFMLIYLKTLLKDTVCLIIGLIYIAYLIIKNFDNLVAKLFLKLPRLLRASIIYSMIILGIFLINKPNEIIVYRDKIVQVEKEIVKAETKEEEVVIEAKEVQACNLSEVECKIYNKAIEQGLSVEQSYIILSISKHETGKWTSNAFNNKHNLGGIMCNTGLKQYNTLDDGIDAFVSLLKNRYFNQGLDTIEKIQPVYCPVGASNDPNNLNQYWLPMVTNYYNEYLQN